MEQGELYNTLTGAYGPVFSSIEMWACIAALGIKPYRGVTGKWCFSYSADGAETVVGLGDTIYEAASHFYRNICQQEL